MQSSQVTACFAVASTAHLPAPTQQLIVDGNGRHPLALPALWCGTDGQQCNQISGALVCVEGQAGLVDAVDVAFLVCTLLLGACSAKEKHTSMEAL